FLCVSSICLTPACQAQQAQVITFTQPPPAQALAGTSVIMIATASSGLPVTFSVVSGPARVSGVNGSTLTFIGVGTVVVQADQAGGNGYSAAPSVQSAPINVQLLTEPVTTSSASILTTVTFSATGTLAQMAAVTQGKPNLDFSLPPGAAADPSRCTVGAAYSVGQTCQVAFAFKPTHPGIRYGGITLSDASGNVLANAYIYGWGVGPQVLYEPIVQTMIGNSFGLPSGVAVNGYGDIFVSNVAGSGAGLVELAANGAVSIIGTFDSGKDVTVDGSGNVFFVTADTLYEIVAVNGRVDPASAVIRTLATGFAVSGGGMSVDGSGNVFVAQSDSSSSLQNPTGLVYEVLAVDGVIPTGAAKQTIGPTFPGPTGVAVDSSGNVYISDEFARGVFELLAVNGQVPASPVIRTLGVGSVLPSNIRLDNTNDIFISDAGYPGVLEYVAVNGVVDPATQPKAIGSGFNQPNGLLVDGAGNVFVADAGFPQIVKLNFSSVPTLNFQPTIVGQTSTDSPMAVTYTNAGNADLIFASPAVGNNPAIGAGDFALLPSSTCPQLKPGDPSAALAIGQSCTDQISFTPQAVGPRSSTLSTTDNDLSVPGSMQVVVLNGTGILKTPTIAFNVSDHFVDDPPFTVMATSDSPAPISYSLVSGPASVAGATVSLTGTTGIVTLKASQPSVIPYDTGSAMTSFNVIKHSETISFTQPATPTSLQASPVNLLATATSGLPVTFSVVSGPATVSGNQLTLTGFGQVVVAADQPGNSIYSPAPTVTRTLIVLDTRVTVTLNATPNPVFLLNPVTFTAAATSPGGIPTGTITLLDGNATLATLPAGNGSGVTFTTSALTLGTHTITAVYGGDATFASKTSTPLNVLVEDFSLTISNPAVTISHGGTAVYHLNVTTIGGINMASTIQLSIAGNPDHSVLTFDPPQIATGSGSTNVTLTIQTPNYPVGPWELSSTHRGAKVFLSLTLLGPIIFCLGIKRRRRGSRMPTLVVLLALLVSASTILGCGTGWGTQPYSMTVTASSGALSHSVAAHLVSQ
ncbi:MAG TPA: Ig-like domain repeat protein, partial [Acidobacteriaceae bacterium]